MLGLLVIKGPSMFGKILTMWTCRRWSSPSHLAGKSWISLGDLMMTSRRLPRPFASHQFSKKQNRM